MLANWSQRPHDGGVTALTISAAPRGPRYWLEDMTWHRRMFGQSQFRWAPEDAMTIALRYTHGRVLYETPTHLRQLHLDLARLAAYTGQISAALVPRLDAAQAELGADGWRTGLTLVGLTELDVAALRASYHMSGPENRSVQRAVRGIPVSNPLSQVWELLQVRSMYTAAACLLEDALCDLVLELAPGHGWERLAGITCQTDERALRERVRRHRDLRGEPGDPRRQPAQSYT